MPFKTRCAQEGGLKTGQAAKIIGSLLILLAVCFLLGRFWHVRDSILQWRISPMLGFTIVYSAIFYALACILLPLAWYWLLGFFGEENVTFRDAFDIYSRNNIARYLPGNMFHIVGRHISGRGLNLGHGALAGSSVYEIIGILVTSSLLALIGLIFSGMQDPMVSIGKIAAIFFLALIFPVVFNRVTPLFSITRSLHVPGKSSLDILRGLSPAFTAYLGYFLLLGLIFMNLLYGSFDVPSGKFIGPVIVVFFVSITAGFITPGAPGGLGVREAIIAGFLAGYVGDTESLLVAFVFRLITITGDLLFFLMPFVLNLQLIKKNP